MLESDASIEQLEGRWPESDPDASRLIRVVHGLRRLPISALTAEDLRILLGQREAVSAVLPRALDLIDADPLTSGDMYPGDLLVVVLRLGEAGALNSKDIDRLRVAIERIRQIDDGSVVGEIWERAASLGIA
ncbi:contact-dependent growth inhibition system immunity protein [Nocardia asteroides]|uniref:contact-dependent growth inhibition system immunity protein n=1 Tax=Nocardia asteroides TaxID=1824 RepID=UPI001E575434|nr:contact-dependent growth inhibition system immunity protein [Nocardia asteroides]UGT64238.1 hypothetical protein LTT61_13495 [Nocardia asteroides]